jgi:adenylate cyclase class IV
MNKKTIEVELRGLMTSEQATALTDRLAAAGIAQEKDDKDTYFFNVPRGIFKMCDEVSKGQGKLSLKIGSEETGALEEREIVVPRAQVADFISFFAALGYGEPHLVPQKRVNYFLPEATLSIKHTPDFQHHFEMEGRLLEDEAEIEAERARLETVCANYGLVPLTPDEITERVAAIRRRIGFAA